MTTEDPHCYRVQRHARNFNLPDLELRARFALALAVLLLLLLLLRCR